MARCQTEVAAPSTWVWTQPWALRFFHLRGMGNSFHHGRAGKLWIDSAGTGIQTLSEVKGAWRCGLQIWGTVTHPGHRGRSHTAQASSHIPVYLLYPSNAIHSNGILMNCSSKLAMLFRVKGGIHKKKYSADSWFKKVQTWTPYFYIVSSNSFLVWLNLSQGCARCQDKGTL